MKHLVTCLAIVFSLACFSSFAVGQAFYPHHPPPSQPKPPPQPPTQVRMPPLRPERLRPPTIQEDNKKEVDQQHVAEYESKEDVLQEVKEIAADQFGEKGETGVLLIEDLDDPHGHSEGFGVDHTYLATQYTGGEQYHLYNIKYNPWNQGYPSGGFWDLPEILTVNGPVYDKDGLLADLPPSAIERLQSHGYRLDDPAKRYVVMCCDSYFNNMVVLPVTEVAPGIYRSSNNIIDLGGGMPHDQKLPNGKIWEHHREWKNVKVVNPESGIREVNKKTLEINLQGLQQDPRLAQNQPATPAALQNNPPQVPPAVDVAKTEQPKEIPSGPETREIKVNPDTGSPSKENALPAEFPDRTQPVVAEPDVPLQTQSEPVAQPFMEITTAGPVRPELLPPAPETQRPTDLEVIGTLDNYKLRDWENKTATELEKKREEEGPLVSFEQKVGDSLVQAQNTIDLDASGDVIIDQFDQQTQKQMLEAVQETGVMATQVGTTATLTYVSVNFPGAGLVISGAQGFKAGYDNSVANGNSTFHSVTNGLVGATTNVGFSLVGGKAVDLGKLKATGITQGDSGHYMNYLIDYAGAVVGDMIGGSATDIVTKGVSEMGKGDTKPLRPGHFVDSATNYGVPTGFGLEM